MVSNAVLSRLGAARTRLVLERPFIGALVLHLPLVPADPRRCETVATDARALYFNPAFIERLSLAQTQFVLAHEAMHCALGHFARRSHRTRHRWDVACDHAVNLLLASEGVKPSENALANPDFRGLSAEEIYPLIEPDSIERTIDAHWFDDRAVDELRNAGPGARGGGAQDADSGRAPESWDDAGNEPRGPSENRTALLPEIDPAEPGELARRWRSRLVSAAQQARRAGRLADSWARLVDDLVQPALPWRAVLARYLVNLARDDYSFQRASRRGGDALLPRLASGELDLHVALDTSGSIGSDELAQFATELDALKGQVRARVTLHACDESLDSRGPWFYEAWEPVVLPEGLEGGGGTSFAPVFAWVASRNLRPGALLYFTDAMGEFPRSAPDYPVIWLVKGKADVPWGRRIQLN